jgi:hypothetical protein
MATVFVDNTFNGELLDNTTYVMTTNMTRSTEFTLASGNTGAGIHWNGNLFKVTVTKQDWTGLFPAAPAPINVWNLSIDTTTGTLVHLAGWIFSGISVGSATNCYSTGDIGDNNANTNCGGIFGAGSSGTATNCYSTGAIGVYGGGIFGNNSSGTATNCYSTGAIDLLAGGIFGAIASGTAKNCYSTGFTGAMNSGPIFGDNSSAIDISSGGSIGWNDASANTYLTGTPNAQGLGAVWNSSAPNTPYTLNPSAACFFGHAPVLTPRGYRRINSIRVGDKVTTPTGEDVVIQIYERSTVAGPENNPYTIPVGTFGALETLLISPRHCIAINGAMVEACNSGLKQATYHGTLTYYNLELKAHSNMIVAGVEVESYVTR